MISTGYSDVDSDFVLLHGAPYWTDMFVRHFLFETDRSIDADDLLFFVRKKAIKGSTRFLMKYEVMIGFMNFQLLNYHSCILYRLR